MQMRCSGHVSSRRVQGVVWYSCRQPELRLASRCAGFRCPCRCHYLVTHVPILVSTVVSSASGACVW
jgi:hypothetical protein